jgi:ssRNA-specific RNase YbeY (16S rRNA maturation enzyme)
MPAATASHPRNPYGAPDSTSSSPLSNAGVRVRRAAATAAATADVDAALLHARAAAALRALGAADHALDIWLADEPRMCQLNREHRGRNEPTDVLSFPHAHAQHAGSAPATRAVGVPGIMPIAAHRADARLGDVAVGVAAARAAARAVAAAVTPAVVTLVAAQPRGCYGRLYAHKESATVLCVDEACWLLLVHGICHLLGHTHDGESDTAKMVDAEEAALRAAASAGLAPRVRRRVDRPVDVLRDA